MLRAFQQLPIDKQQKILDSAASVFAEEGYHFASISSICKSAEISNGALYKYFKNKESLYFSVVDYMINLVENSLYKKYIVNVDSLYDGIYKLLKGLSKFTECYPDYICIYCDLGSSSMNRFASVIAQKFKNATSMYTIKMIEESKQRGEIDSNINTSIASYMVDNYITFFAYSLVSEYHSERFKSFFIKENRKITEDEAIDLIVESLKQAFRK
ncbi:TetR/AcrR family transcriptional regulator [Clostridium sp. WILCCON 0269]|uniref:TetR/AcrR family transcriptional regulator n=1 Tax=Candidatus Clostridium eludens TaxID=3381663 RepID=A0ABW8SQ18_9CLOT